MQLEHQHKHRSSRETDKEIVRTHPNIWHEPYKESADEHECGEGNEGSSKTETLDHHTSAEEGKQEGDGVGRLWR